MQVNADAVAAPHALVHEHVRQITLSTDDEPGTRAFYASLGFVPSADHGLTHYLRA